MPVDYAQITSTEDQRPTVTTPVAIELNQNDSISGIEHSVENPGTIKIRESGIYVLISAPQVGRTSGEKARFVDFWLRKNGRGLVDLAVTFVLLDLPFFLSDLSLLAQLFAFRGDCRIRKQSERKGQQGQIENSCHFVSLPGSTGSRRF